MVRLFGALVGLGFILVLIISMITGISGFLNEPPAESVEHKFHKHPKDVAFSFDGPFGKYDRAQLQRGFQVYKEVCASCHSLGYVAFRNLEEIGYNEEEVKAIANQWQIEVPSVDPKTGEANTRKPIAADAFPSPYANEVAARAANNNAMPPDLSLMAKARHGGAAYIYSLLTGYQNPPADLPAENRPGQGLHFNPYFPNLNIAMPPPLTGDGQVTYGDGTNGTRDQAAKDVSAFLAWTAEPRLENRHRTGIAVLIFLLIATVLAYLAYKQIWATAKRDVRLAGPLDPENMARREYVKADAAAEGRGVEG